MDVTELRIIPADSVIVSFELSYADWCIIRESRQWKELQNLSEEIEKKRIRTVLKETQGL